MAEIRLTPEQQAVIDDRGGTLLVSAAAGSGKTKVLLDRVLKRVEEDQKCNVDDFLMITFTQAAAAELRGKLLERLSQRLAEMPENRHLQKQMNRIYLAQISTIHSFCSSILRDYAHVVDLPADFRIIDDQEGRTLTQRAMDRVLEEAYAMGREDRNLREALDMFSGSRNKEELSERIRELYNVTQCYPDPEARLQELEDSLDLSHCKGVEETLWGRYLMEEFRRSMEQSAQVINSTTALLPEEPKYDKYRAYNEVCTNLFRQFGQAKTWDEIRRLDFAPGKAPGLPQDPPFRQIKDIRSSCSADLKKWKTETFAQSSQEALQDIMATVPALRGLISLTRSFRKQFSREKESYHGVDYNDLEHLTLKLLVDAYGNPTPAAREISQRYTELMVDEYQDTNAVQDAIFQSISKDGKNLFFVGDVKQSIYGFRMADPSIFLGKYQSFADHDAAKDGEPRRILLSHNFRSRPEILEAANDVFRLCMTERVGGLRYGDAEALRPNLPGGDMGGPAVELHLMQKGGEKLLPPISGTDNEAELVAHRIAQMLEQGELIPDGDGLRPIRPEDIVILLRNIGKTNPKAPIYTKALQKHGIRCVYGSENIFETEEIIILRALLQIIDNPHQDIPLLTALLSPLFCFTSDDLAQARSGDRKGDLLEALEKLPKAEPFFALLGQLRDLAQTSPLRTLLDAMDEKLYLRAIFGGMKQGSSRLQNLDRFCALADAYESGDRHGLSGFLRYLDRLDSVSSGDAANVGAVRIMTMHKSKGLQFPVVFLPGLYSPFNIDDSTRPVLIHSKLGIVARVHDWENNVTYSTPAVEAVRRCIKAQNRSEEIRVLYVAMTRAQYRLVMVGCDKNLASDLTKKAAVLTDPIMDSLTEDVNCMGKWVAMTALTHTEAGELFAVTGPSGCAHVPEHPWKICWHNGEDYLPNSSETEEAAGALQREREIDYDPLERLHRGAEQAPSKLTATQLKGRSTDEEIREGTVQVPTYHFRKPRFTQERSLSPTERGTAIHLAMQYLRYEACRDLEGVRRELDRLVEEKFLSPQQREAVPPVKLLRFFRSPIGQRILSAKKLVREFKFSVLEDGTILDPKLAGEEILLQGVTDCGILEEDGLTIIDFKSDRVTEESEAERAEYYRGQVDAYSRALSKVFDCPVKERILYFFATDHAVSV